MGETERQLGHFILANICQGEINVCSFMISNFYKNHHKVLYFINL